MHLFCVLSIWTFHLKMGCYPNELPICSLHCEHVNKELKIKLKLLRKIEEYGKKN